MKSDATIYNVDSHYDRDYDDDEEELFTTRVSTISEQLRQRTTRRKYGLMSKKKKARKKTKRSGEKRSRCLAVASAVHEPAGWCEFCDKAGSVCVGVEPTEDIDAWEIRGRSKKKNGGRGDVAGARNKNGRMTTTREVEGAKPRGPRFQVSMWDRRRGGQGDFSRVEPRDERSSEAWWRHGNCFWSNNESDQFFRAHGGGTHRPHSSGLNPLDIFQHQQRLSPEEHYNHLERNIPL